MSALGDFIRILIARPYEDSKPRRKRFFLEPLAMMKKFNENSPIPLSQRDMSVIMSLDFRLIIEEANDSTLGAEIRAFVAHNDGDDDWPKRGKMQWNPWENGRQCQALGTESDDYRSLWSGPESGIKHLFRTSAVQGERFALQIAGEGLLPGATMVLRPTDTSQQPITAEADDYIPCNIRRSYLSATFAIPRDAWCGEYELFLWNAGLPEKRMYWVANFEITGDDCDP